LSKNISEKDKEDWKKFLESKDKVEDKDAKEIKFKNSSEEKTIDLHGYSLEDANEKINNLIYFCFENNILKLNVITGKGSRSKNKNDPHQSIDLSILKYSVPNFIKNNEELMKKIKFIDLDKVNDVQKGNFSIFLKLKNKLG
tara:strand:- start:187 stop:612 length:426 start_codon:yes stop_codon:yes gene_type:complete